jgi:2-C-methyl-D-erythritol 2,4-cyclodiphosphate synthase
MVRKENASLVNVDSTIVAEEPKLSGHIQKMRENISAALKLSVDRVSVKATTTEGMGFAGRKEGMAAYAVVLVERE